MHIFRISKLLSVFILCVCLSTATQMYASDIVTEKIILKSGKAYTGEIILRNEELIILKLNDGTRFQFKLSDIAETLIVAQEEEKQDKDVPKEIDSFISGMIELSGGVSAAKFKTAAVPFCNLNISFGSDQFGDGTFYLGLGTGFFAAYIRSSEETIGFIPVFVNGRKTFSRRITSLFLGLDMGYAFASKKEYKGGIYSKLNFGIQKRLSYKTTVSGSLFAGVSGYGAELIEQNSNGNFRFIGQTALVSTGLSIGIQF